ncbi:MAG: alanine racemase [Actinomycetota bacterium]|jgi:alanine racemase|nr:alanine racemase [Actinomycetota bacterium]
MSEPAGASAPTRIASGGTPRRYAVTEPPAQRPTWAQVDLDAIAANVGVLKRQAAAGALMAVVKADGYGHGLVPAGRAALAGGADWLAVALVEEGAALRAAGVTAPILVMTEPPVTAIPALLGADLTPAVYTGPYASALAAAAADHGLVDPVAVHLKLDTGMRRVGVPQSQWQDALRQIRDTAGLHLQGLWSHFAVADEPDNPFIAQQAAEFRRGVAMAQSVGVPPDITHLANSAGTLQLHDDHYDMVRPGLAVYGLEPAPGLFGDLPLRPALSWWTRLSLVKRLAVGESISYGLRWTASRATTVATVPAGYADGVTRALSNRGEVVVRGCRLPIAGTVCMDQFLVDAGDTEVAAGDDVCLLGEQDGVGVTAQDWAAWLGTINYEVVCGIGRRVPRVYLGGSTG